MLKSTELNQNTHCSYMRQHILLTRLSGLDLTSNSYDESNFKLTTTTDHAQNKDEVQNSRNSFSRTSNNLPLSDSIFFNNSNNTQLYRKKKIPSPSMQGALKVLNDSLIKTNKLPSENALNIIKNEWFHISSSIDANPLDVEDYLDTFEDISSKLLEFIVNLTDNNYNTAMHYAISYCNFDIVSILLDSKVCDINKINRLGYTSFMLLISLPQIQITNQVNVIRKLFELADVNLRATKQHGQTTLMLAASHGNYNLVQMLLDVGADVNIRDDDGSTALMCATEFGHLNIVDILLKQPDCNSTIADNDRKTALDIAIELKQQSITALIYNHQLNMKTNTKIGRIMKEGK